ncbi:UPF0481 protein At3g47200-like [Quercus lobata]|uniref:Uncharacterized protein n=1 Tax=Quercus lobata TaxID=97700 RepID=A0A7N2M1R2_QUELO|nr:UPF0481 protein At3g47200-like [Quercus lobata]
MEHVISMEEFHSRKVERRETGEASRGHDQPVSVDVAKWERRITIQENEIYSTSFEKENFKKLKEAQVKGKNRWTTKPKIQKVLLLRGHKHFKKYCEPRVVSIGPIHHGKPKYRLAEEYKLTLAGNFIEKSGKAGKELYMVIKNNIEQLRECFDEEVIHNYNDEALAWMLFVDGCATLKFIDSVVEKKVKEFQIKNGQVAFVQQDLFLLENQLPYRILDDLIKNSNEGENLRKSVQSFINMQSMRAETEETPPKNNKEGEKTEETPPNKESVHLLDLLRNRLLGYTSTSLENNSNQEDWNSFRNVQELRAVGIHLKSSNDSCLRNITFIKKWNFYGGTLSLPPIIVDDSTGPKFFNLIAYEMCPDFENDYGVTSYISFLDSLIDEAKDVIDLRKEGILRNLLGSDEEVALVFNEIGTDLVPNPEIYRDVRSKIQKYHEKKRMTYINEVIHNHFSSPWTVVAFTAALFALILSIAQTVYSILAYYQ